MSPWIFQQGVYQNLKMHGLSSDDAASFGKKKPVVFCVTEITVSHVNASAAPTPR